MENNEFNKSNSVGSEEVNPPSANTGGGEDTPVSPQQSFENNPEKKSIGAVIGSIIVIVIIIIGGLYFWGKQIAKKDALLNTTAEEIQKQPDEVLDALETQGVSDEIADIEADLNATDLDDLEKELENIDLEFSL